MIIHGFMAKYAETGGSAIFSYVAELLTVRLGHYGSAIESMRVIVFLRCPTRDPWIGLEKRFDDFHEFMNRLPKITFHRRLKRVDIQFASKQFNSEDDLGWQPSVDKCNRAMGEVLESLALLKKRIKPSDDFNLNRFLADANRILTTTIDSTDEWLQISEEAGSIETAVDEGKSEWDLLEIDWDRYHPAARTILDDPFYWDPADDRAPHGNDTGADLLKDYIVWEKRNKRNQVDSPLKFLDREMKAWEVAPLDWLVDDETGARKLAKEKPAEMTLCNEAAIALAFAVLKTRGACPRDVLRLALAAIRRRTILLREFSFSDSQKARWETALTMMKQKLESIPAT